MKPFQQPFLQTLENFKPSAMSISRNYTTSPPSMLDADSDNSVTKFRIMGLYGCTSPKMVEYDGEEWILELGSDDMASVAQHQR